MPTYAEYVADHPEAAPKKRQRHPEWSLQTKIKGFVSDFCAIEHEFVAHDRTYDKSGVQHLFEAERGIRRGWMDTELAVEGGMTFRCELKWWPNKVVADDDQDRLIKRMNQLDHPTAWTSSVAGYLAHARDAGVPFRQGADARAAYLDEMLRTTFAAPKAAKKRTASKPRPPKDTSAARRMAAAFYRR